MRSPVAIIPRAARYAPRAARAARYASATARYAALTALCLSALGGSARAMPAVRGIVAQLLPRTERTSASQCCLFVSVASGSQSELLALDRNPPYEAMGNVAPEPGGDPWYLALSETGVLYVGDPVTSTVYGYTSGFGQPPTRTYVQAGSPTRPAVGKDGTLYVAVSVSSGASSYVVEYPKGRTKPGLMLTGPTNFIGLSLAVDRGGTVYVASESKGTEAIQLITFPPKSASGTVATLDTQGASQLSGGMAVDKHGNLLLGLIDADACPHVYVFPAGSTSPAGEIGPPNSGYCGGASNIRSLSLFGDRLYVAMFDEPAHHVVEYAYPKGKFIAAWAGPQDLTATLTVAAGNAQASM
jgi:hypothetical protein